jgi:S-methylmethionine-dependent homocysteine/selenocysteine methylase
LHWISLSIRGILGSQILSDTHSFKGKSTMLASLLASGKVLLADGATGTNLFAMGLTSGDAPEMWNFDYPERVKALHQGFVTLECFPSILRIR